MKKGLLSLVFGFAAIFATAQCDAVSEIEENFEGWDELAECWTGVSNGGMFLMDGNVTFYGFMSANLDMYLISPEIQAGEYTLRFDFATNSLDGSEVEGMTLEVGTLTSNENVDSFVSLGAPISTTVATQNFEATLNMEEDLKYFVIKVHTTTPHSAAWIDNLVLGTTMGVSDLEVAAVQVYPNPVSDQMQISSEAHILEVKIYSLAGQLVQNLKPNGKSAKLNVSALKAGVYLAQIITEKGVQTVKVLKK